MITAWHRTARPVSSGQSTLEYALFMGVVAAAIVAMTPYLRRAIQANLKILEEQVNAQAVR